jgi:hypothetical protein
MKLSLKIFALIIILTLNVTRLYSQSCYDNKIKNVNDQGLFDTSTIDTKSFETTLSLVFNDYLLTNKKVSQYFDFDDFLDEYFPRNTHCVRIKYQSIDTTVITITPIYFKSELDKSMQLIMEESGEYFLIQNSSEELGSKIRKTGMDSIVLFLDSTFHDSLIFEKSLVRVKDDYIFKYLLINSGFGIKILSGIFITINEVDKKYWPIREYNTTNQLVLGINLDKIPITPKKYWPKDIRKKDFPRWTRKEKKEIDRLISNKYRQVL